jgi:hypothetical protein
MATNENIVTDRTTEGAKPARIPNNQSEHNMTINCNKEPLLLFGTGLSIKVTNSKTKPMCKPETERI